MGAQFGYVTDNLWSQTLNMWAEHFEFLPTRPRDSPDAVQGGTGYVIPGKKERGPFWVCVDF